MGKIIEGVWDCKYCDTKKIRGSVTKCPNCGRPRDIDTKFYIDNPKNYISDEKAEKLNKNPDWLCSFCDSLNSDDNNICYNCGASREESKENYFTNQEKKRKAKEEKQTINEKYQEIVDELYEKTKSGIEENKSEKENEISNGVLHKRFFESLIVTVVPTFMIFLFIFLCTFVLSPKTKTVTVKDFSWERNVVIEEYKTVEESDWTLPQGGRLQYKQTEFKEYKKVLDHYETKTRTYNEQVVDHYETVVTGHRDLGNGHFEEITTQRPVYRTETKTEAYQEPVYRQEPVYDTKYYYEIDKWVFKEDKKTKGNDKEPFWTDYECKENERQGDKEEKYKIKTENKKGKIKEYILSFDEWNSLSKGETVKLKVYVDGSAKIKK